MASARLPLSGAIAKHRSQTSAQVTELSSYLRAADFSVHPVVRLLALRCARARVRVRRAASSFIMDQRGITVSRQPAIQWYYKRGYISKQCEGGLYFKL